MTIDELYKAARPPLQDTATGQLFFLRTCPCDAAHEAEIERRSRNQEGFRPNYLDALILDVFEEPLSQKSAIRRHNQMGLLHSVEESI